MRDREFKEDEEHLIDIFDVKVCDTYSSDWRLLTMKLLDICICTVYRWKLECVTGRRIFADVIDYNHFSSQTYDFAHRRHHARYKLTTNILRACEI